ncbi:MAG: RES domain-containing protein [Acidimicrobiales bacterium]|nr:RES domain-containing protein [Acidimicrobiales bacterium]
MGVDDDWLEAAGYGMTGIPELAKVCPDCLPDPHLSDWVVESGRAAKCDVCGRANKVAWFSDLFAEMQQRIAAELLPFSMSDEVPGAEWEIDPPTVGTAELLDDLGEPLGPVDSALSAAFCAAFEDNWIPVGAWAGTLEDWLNEGWDRFAETVKTTTRFVFAHTPRERWMRDVDIAPGEMLARIGEVIRTTDIVTPHGNGIELFRGRKHHPAETYSTPAELGPPPVSKAGNQRMSPPGISFFYAAADDETALAELRGVDGEYATTATWMVNRLCRVVDLDPARMPDMPSIFDLGRRHLRAPLAFLLRFAEEIAKPVRAGDDPAVDYVPTQVVAEYIRHIVRTSTNDPIDGIRYPSAARRGGANVVLFVGPEGVAGATPLLRMTSGPRRFEAVDTTTVWEPRSL